MSTVIYKLCSTTLDVELVLPSLNDIKLVVMDNDELLDLLLRNKLRVEEVRVSTDSCKYRTAIKNRMIQVKSILLYHMYPDYYD